MSSYTPFSIGALACVCGGAVRMASAQVVRASLVLHPEVHAQLLGAPSEEALSDDDTLSTLHPFI